MNILGVDYGSKKIGLAWVDTALKVVLPFGVVGDQRNGRLKDQVAELIKKEKIDKLVVGLPLGLDGKENDNTRRVRKFADELKKEIKISVDFVDERFTSVQADRTDSGVVGASRDEKSAMIILEAYLAKSS
ncbi:MAG: Holliday junction resolvase RuvX [Candidatus Magasanikbacteria bacterium]|nr:Holliday junction resolvase RuvX [Candidatus Magasanikbacteria bacterium]